MLTLFVIFRVQMMNSVTYFIQRLTLLGLLTMWYVHTYNTIRSLTILTIQMLPTRANGIIVLVNS